MAKTYNRIFPEVYDFEALCSAHQRARRGKRYRGEVLRFSRNLEPELIQLQNELTWGSYRTGPYRYFYVHEPKTRMVASLPYRDRVVQHSLVAAIEPIWEARFLHDSYACRPGKGMHAGADRAQDFMRRIQRNHGKVYALKADISKYFPSIDHGVLKALVRRRIACPGTLWLLDEIIDSSADPDDPAPAGIPIGNLTSQLLANVYLHELDKFVKRELREPYYLRYMDDFVVMGPDKDHLHRIRQDIEAFLWERLRLTTNDKTQVFPVAHRQGRGLDFLGFRMWPTHRRLRKQSIRRMRRKMRAYARRYAAGRVDLDQVGASVQSWVGHASHADTHQLRAQVLGERTFTRTGGAEDG